MAGEITKTTSVSNFESGNLADANIAAGKTVTVSDTHQFAAATELEAADSKIYNIRIPSNAVIQKVEMYNDDMDTHACPTLAIDIGLFAGQDYTSITSGTKTKFAVNDIVDVDLLVDGVTTGQSATTNWTALTPDSATFGPEDACKEVWELLGYDEDPKTTFLVGLTSATASAALSAAADCSLRVTYTVR